MMDIHEFHRALGASLDALGKASGAEEQVRAAQRRLDNLNQEIAARADAHAQMKADSDAHLAANRQKWAEELRGHEDALSEAKKKQAQLNDLHKSQEEAAGATLSQLNADVAKKLKARDELSVQIEQMKGTIHELASKL